MTSDQIAAEAAAWDRVRVRLRLAVGEQAFTSWFPRVELKGVAAGVVTLSVPTNFLRSWIQRHYLDGLTSLWREELACTRVDIAVRTAAVRRMPNPTVSLPVINQPKPASEEPIPDLWIRSPTDPRMTFAAFRAVDATRLLHAAAMKVATAGIGDLPVFNPLFVHGGAGLGKTHLLQAIAAEVSESGRRAVYVTAERFMTTYINALRETGPTAFRQQLRSLDILLIDDLQFLRGKSVIAEFQYTLNSLLESGRQVVLAADRSPAEFELFDERLRSRLAGGLVLEVSPFDEDNRLAILKSRADDLAAKHAGFTVCEDVLGYIAANCSQNGRMLEGALTRLLAHNQLSGTPITLDMAKVTVSDLVTPAEPRRVRVDDIMQIVAKHYQVTRADIMSQRRTANVVRPRQIAMFLAKTLTLRSLPEIGRRFGGRDHTTVLHAVRKMEGLRLTDRMLADEIGTLTALVTGEAHP